MLRLCVRIDTHGRVTTVRLLKSFASQAGEAEVLKQLRSVRFTPAVRGGRPISAWTRIDITGDPGPVYIL